MSKEEDSGQAPYVWAWSGGVYPEVMVAFRGDRYETDKDAYLRVLSDVARGRLVPEADVPDRMWIRADRSDRFDGRRLPPILGLGSDFIGVSAIVAQVLQQFDLGNTDFSPVQLLKSDRKTAFDGEYFTMRTTELKEGFEPERSTGFRKPALQTQTHLGLVSFIGQKDGDNKVNSTVLQGPHLWRDPRLDYQLFLSASLGDALRSAKLQGKTKMLKCTILSDA